MKGSMRYAFALLTGSLMVSTPPTFAQAPTAIDDLREELNALKAAYEARIEALERRIEALAGSQARASTGLVERLEQHATAAVRLEDEAARTAAETRDSAQRHRTSPATDVLAGSARKSFEFHGYMRSGFGVNSKGGDMAAFEAPGIDHKYRLGNEAETYGEVLFRNNFQPQVEDPFFNVQVRLAYHTEESNGSDPDHDQFSLRESFVQAGNFAWAPGVSFWAGERFYRRHDIHINDFYVYDMSGYGGGVEDVPMPAATSRLAVAYIGGSSDDYEFPSVGRVAKNTFDIRWYDVPVPFGEAMFWLAPSALKGGTYRNSEGEEAEYESAAGFAAGLMHLRNFEDGGYNSFTLQYGRGTGSDFSPNVQDPTPDLDKAWLFRATESVVTQPSDSFSMESALIYQLHNNGAAADALQHWASAGMRPIWMLNRHLALAVEGGVDYVDSEPDDDRGYLFKFTVAPEIRFGRLFFDRPVLRAFATYGRWTDDFEGRIGGDAFADRKDGFNFGLQAEAWW